jgi:hypothetical protein
MSESTSREGADQYWAGLTLGSAISQTRSLTNAIQHQRNATDQHRNAPGIGGEYQMDQADAAERTAQAGGGPGQHKRDDSPAFGHRPESRTS